MGSDELLITIAIQLDGEDPIAVVDDVLDSVMRDYPEAKIDRMIRHKNGVVVKEERFGSRGSVRR